MGVPFQPLRACRRASFARRAFVDALVPAIFQTPVRVMLDTDGLLMRSYNVGRSPQNLKKGRTAMGHHHHKRGDNCEHGEWATTEEEGHHHHKRGNNCGGGFWATSTVAGHHHHERGGDCVEHQKWATGEDIASDAL